MDLRLFDHNPRGYASLLAVLVLTAAGTLLVLGIVLGGLHGVHIVGALSDGTRARSAADACAEEALNQLWTSGSYAGSGGDTVGAVSCTYAVTSLGGDNRRINATGTVNGTTRRVQALVDNVTTTVHVSSWLEVSSF